MRPPGFPFPALVGLESLKLALQLAAIDFRLSVLVRGDKGAGKSTAARGLADLLEDGAPFVNLPIGATEDRLLGGLDVQQALKGLPALKPGLLADADGGVLYIDEINLLPDHLADALLDAVASGLHVVEREGFSVTQPARFVLVGSMNPEEGALRPQLLDRFALTVDVSAPLDPPVRREVIERRLSYDADPARFVEEWRAECTRLARQIQEARRCVLDVAVPRDVLDLVTSRIAAEQVGSLRADLATVRGSRALAALEGAAAVGIEHVEAVLPLALAHRGRVAPATYSAVPHGTVPRSAPLVPPAPPSPPEPPAPPAPPSEAPNGSSVSEALRDSTEASPDAPASARERVFAPLPVHAPRLVVDCDQTAPAPTSHQGVTIGARRTPEPKELDARATLSHALTRSAAGAGSVVGAGNVVGAESAAGVGSAAGVSSAAGAGSAAGANSVAPANPNVSVTITADDLHERIRSPRVGTRYLFVLDSSGSHAVHDRMRLVKGAVAGLLAQTHRREDEVVVIACRGAAAHVLVEPTSMLDDVQRALDYVPTGGRTPLAHALELAATFVTDTTVAIILTDGHANVPTRSDDPWADALNAALALRCPSVLVDSESEGHATGRPRQLAEAMYASYVRLNDLDDLSILHVIRKAF